jgi:cell division control protein 42
VSLENIRDKWVPEVRHFCPDVPFIIVAMQIDLRDDSEVVKRLASEKQRLVSTQEGERLAHELGAAKYLECSSLMQKGVDDVFHEVRTLSGSSSVLIRPMRPLLQRSSRPLLRRDGE